MQGLASSVLAWIGFCIFIVLMLAIDLGVFNRRPHEIGYKNAALWSAVWVTLAGIFAALLFGPLGWEQVAPEEVGALTSAPIISNGIGLFGFMDYQVVNFLEELAKGKTVVWVRG